MKKFLRLQTTKRTAIDAFLVFHIVAIACWCVPFNVPPLLQVRRFVRPYFVWSGLFQSWDMFAPVPKAANTYIEAVIVYRDGSRKNWTLPRMDQLGLTEKYFKERYRKFEDTLQQSENDALLLDVARRVARLNSSPANPVRTVILIQNYSFNVPRPDGSNAPQPWQQHVLLGYGVQPEDLR